MQNTKQKNGKNPYLVQEQTVNVRKTLAGLPHGSRQVFNNSDVLRGTMATMASRMNREAGEEIYSLENIDGDSYYVYKR